MKKSPSPAGRTAAILCLSLLSLASSLHAASYASGISITGGTTVNFTLNEPADLLTYRINGGAPQTLSGAASGTKTFTLTSPSDTFSITATKTAATGYTIPTGTSIASVATGLGAATPASGYNLISPAGGLTIFNSPRGVAVSSDPNSPYFGTAYIANSASGTTQSRTLGDGLYALKADGSDAFAYGNTAQNGGITNWASSASASAPFRISVGPDTNVYISDFSDATGTVWRTSGTLTAGTNVLAAIGGPGTLPVGQNHGSTTAVFVSGSQASGNMTLYTLDEDLTSANVGGVSTADKNSLWRYDIGSGALPYAGMPTKVNLSDNLLPGALSDLDRGANGLTYLSQNRSDGLQSGLFVLDATGATIYDSLTASASLGNGAVDIFRNIQGIAVSPDQKFLAVMVNNSDVAIIPLDANGIPRIQDRLLVDTGTDVISGRDIAFDAAGNIHYVSSGQGAYRVLSPGGYSEATTSFNGTSYSFSIVPEPSVLGLAGIALLGLIRRRR